MIPHLQPDGRQNALAFVVARTILVRFPEVTSRDRAVDRRDDLAEGDVRRVPGQYVAAPDTALGAHEASTLAGEKDLLEIGLRQGRALGESLDRGRRVLVHVQR